MSELIIRILGQNEDAKNKIKEITKEAKSLQKDLGDIAKKSGLVFAGTTAAIAGTVAMWRTQEQALFRQQAVLKSTGYAAGITTMELQKMASGLQDVSTFGDEAIIQGQNLLLTFKQIGKDVFPKATEVMLDVATAMDQDLKTSAIQMGKALNDPITGITALSRVGITFTEQQKEQIKTMQESGNIAGAQTLILKELESQFGGAAKAAAQGTGYFIQLKNVFGDIVEQVGKKFTPVLVSLAKPLMSILTLIRDNEAFATFAAKVLGVTAGISGLIVGITSAVLVISKIKTALDILGIAMTATRIKAALMWGAVTLGIGLVITFLPEIIAFAKAVKNIFTQVADDIILTFKNLGTNLYNIGSKIGQLLKDIFTLNFGNVSKSASELKNAVANTIDSAFNDIKTVTQRVKVEIKKEAAPGTSEEIDPDKAKAEAGFKAAQTKEGPEAAIDEAKKQARLERAKIEAEELQSIRAKESEDAIKLKQDEIAILKEIEDAKTQMDVERAQLRLEQFREKEAERRAAIFEEKALEREQELELREMYKELDEEDRKLVEETELQNLTDKEIKRRAIIKESLMEERREREQDRKQFLKDELKHGTAVATLKKALRSEEVQGVRNGTAELVQLQNSRNNTLKSIGKAAAITQIVLKTATSAMNAYESLSVIPIIGPALGAAAAAAVIAYGAEQLATARSAQTGGIVPGVGQGDKVPMMLEPGEIVVPKPLAPTFQEQFQIEKDKDETTTQPLNITIQGDVIGDEEYVDTKLIPKISAAVRFRNADLGIA